MSWEVGPGNHVRDPWLCLSQDHLHILKGSYWSTSDRQLNGTAQAEASMDLLEAWGLTGVGHCPCVFKTTARNSGVHRGAAKLLEQQLDRKVFYLACRHHILEVLVGAVWENLFGKVKSPENPWFKPSTTFGQILPQTTLQPPPSTKMVNKKKKECKEILQEILRSEKPPRADYREMAELTLIVLGDTPPRGIHWSRPGAIHQGARWMARNLYSYEDVSCLLSSWSTMKNCCEAGTPQPLLGLFYTPMWMSSTLAADAPGNDLQFMKDMMKFKRTDPEIAQAVLQKLENHKWYLTQEVVPFALFGSRLSDKRSRTFAAKLHATEKPDSFRRGKPMFPQVTAKRLWLI
ncbi:hypothetical protein GWK47_048588 [Chionoecetes opilio]|uniref:Uncharacterized protein n=1 Tax=Chionoecetes opilio TaxID=41210 RepID=A0A8J4Y3S8_CHIOP|nr:hypothetical protein GWK47_048588 [Chionoecetes opilio]